MSPLDLAMQSPNSLTLCPQGPSGLAALRELPPPIIMGAWAWGAAGSPSWTTLVSRGPMKESTARWAMALPVPMAAPCTTAPIRPDIMPPPPPLWEAMAGGAADMGAAGAGALDPPPNHPELAGCWAWGAAGLAGCDEEADLGGADEEEDAGLGLDEAEDADRAGAGAKQESRQQHVAVRS